ncbi:hypothetical protein CI109_102102 [Kwoniella shandongensis]|uniref:Uncharacterized protein n=1 Tax=Kwoniella shandongensis TaxID=1734106 RepID=A0A5M6BXW6_9TREE|nr:uncharacterized protein CI109_005873 [Kwoniella shandongensis]KAA5525849.1 hypothetical protein CI109_005873 [Kwoniella shandongensis]
MSQQYSDSSYASSQPPYSPATPDRRRGVISPQLPPGAIDPSAPPGLSHSLSNVGYTSSPPLPRLPSERLDEFGHSAPPLPPLRTVSSSSARRPLPTQPTPPSLASNHPSLHRTPPAVTPLTPGSGSVGHSGRRALPTPPSLTNRTSSSRLADPSPPLPQPRTVSRSLPVPPPGPRSRTVSASSAFAEPQGPPPPPPPRPQQAYSPLTNFAPAAQNDRAAPLGLGHPSGRLSDLKYGGYQDSPNNVSPSPQPATGGYFDSPRGPSRAPSQSQSVAGSSSSGYISRSTSQSTRESSVETGATSVVDSSIDHDSWLPILERFGDLTTVNESDILQPPDTGTFGLNFSPSSDAVNGRGTPTQKDWFTGPPSLGKLEGKGNRERAESGATAMPGTPTGGDERFAKQGGLLDAPFESSQQARTPTNEPPSVSFPAHPTSPQMEEGTWSSGDTVPGTLNRENSERSQVTNYSTQSSYPDSRSISSTGTPDHQPQRQASFASCLHPRAIISLDRRSTTDLSPSWTQQTQQPSHWVERKLQIHQSRRDELDDDSMHGPSGWEEEEEEWAEEEEEELDVDEGKFFQPAFLSEMALQLRDKVERQRLIKTGIAWVGSFTGKDIVTTIQGLLPAYTRNSPSDRRFALILAQSLQNQLWFVEVDWDIKPLRDSSDDVFRFMGEMEGMGSGGDALTTELPKGLMSMATRCYSPSCTSDQRCYSPRCPYRTNPDTFLPRMMDTPLPTPASVRQHEDWKEDVDPLILRDLDQHQMARQNVIRQALTSEIAYEADLTAMEKLFIDPLRQSDPPLIPDSYRRERFIHEVFNNALQLREACRRLIEEFTIRMREQPIILSVGDLFLQAATEFRNIYPEYTGRLPQAEAALTKEMDENTEFRLFIERIVRENDKRRDIKYLITRPSTQLQRYPAVLEGILNATDHDDPDREFLYQALQSIQNISSLSQLKLFHASKGRGPAGKLQWYDLVPEEQRAAIEKKEQKRQMQIWELIQGEMEYVADLETIETLFVNGLRMSDPAVIDRNRLDVFLDEAFHNYRSLLEVHSRLLENLQFRQLEQHPNVGIISDLIFDAALNWQEAYMEYVTHYPIAKAKVQEEEARNPKFAAFLQTCLKDPSSNRQDVYHFINRPIPRLLRYNLLLADILKSLKEVGPPDHPDIEQIPQVMEVITDLGKATQKGVAVNESKVELWGFQHTLDGSRFGPRMVKDLDLANPMRELIHKGKVFRQPEGSIGGSWTELIVLLFDHYLVLAKPERASRSSRRETRQVRYIINRRPIPLELLSLGHFSDAPRQRGGGRLFGVGGGGASTYDPVMDGGTDPSQADNRTVYPFSISFIGQGQLGGSYTLWADSAGAREEWKEKLQHAKVLRNEVNDAGKVFEMNPLSVDTFFMAANYAMPRDKDDTFTGRVTCSCPFVTQDNRKLVAVGCQEGVWIGVRSDPKSLRKVLHVKAVMNVAVLEEFSMFLVLAEKSLFAYHLEALVPSAGQRPIKTAPERVSIPREEISFFTVGRLDGRTLVVTMKKETTQSVFRILEPVLNRSTEDNNRQRRPFGFLGKTSDWFRPYKMFYLPAEVYGLHFLKHKMAIVCSKGFEIMDLTDLKGGSIPIFDPAKTREKPMLSELERKCQAGKPIGMFRSTETEFLLCYDTFGLYVDRHGEPNRDRRAIEWEGRPDSIAFHPPYLLLISAPFIEIRHIDTARLLQIYTGSDIRLTWDGSGGQKNPPIENPGKNGYGEETKIQEPQIHICQRAQDLKPTGRGVQGIGQAVYELSPTLLLNNPLMNPFNTHDSNYLPPPPLTSQLTPQIRQARPPSIMTTHSGEMYPSASPNPNFGHSRNNSYTNSPTPVPGPGYGYNNIRDNGYIYPNGNGNGNGFTAFPQAQPHTQQTLGYGGPNNGYGYGGGRGSSYSGSVSTTGGGGGDGWEGYDERRWDQGSGH